MKYTSQNADNLPRFVPNGDYAVIILEASETFSKGGDEMLKLKLEVEGHGVHLYDYLVATPNSFWKIDTFRRSIGEPVIAGEEVELIASKLERKRGFARLRVEEYQGKKNNKVELWLTDRKAVAANHSEQANAAEEDCDVPF